MNHQEYDQVVTSPNHMSYCIHCHRQETKEAFCIEIEELEGYQECVHSESLIDDSNDPEEELRTLAYEFDGMDRSDAQGAVEAEDMQKGPYACVRCREKAEALDGGLCENCISEISVSTDPPNIVEKALEAFWDVIVKANPQCATGDLSPLTLMALDQAAENAVTEWIASNTVSK